MDRLIRKYVDAREAGTTHRAAAYLAIHQSLRDAYSRGEIDAYEYARQEFNMKQIAIHGVR